MTCSMMKSAGGFGDTIALTDLRRRRALGKMSGWQTFSPWCSGPASVGPAGRRLEALFSGGLARSLIQGGRCLSQSLAGWAVAASRNRKLTLVALVPAALGGVGVDEAFYGTDERSSQSRCLMLVDEGTEDAGVGLAAGLK
jgi:hypothetical protein